MIKIEVTDGLALPSSAKDVPCLVDPPEHNWYKNGDYMKCSKCRMSYENPQPSGVFYYWHLTQNVNHDICFIGMVGKMEALL